MKILSVAFASRAGIPGKICADVWKGKLRPRMIIPDPPAEASS